MKARTIRIIAVLALLAGVVIFCWPYITQYFYDQNVSKIVESFEADVQSGGDTLLDTLYQRMVRENEQLSAKGQMQLRDPFAYEQAGLDLVPYGLTDNIVGYISIPKMDIVLPIYLGASLENMKLGAVHLTQTSYPVGGPDTNCVIAAHRGYRKALMFRRIELLETGDSVEIRNFRETLTWRVVEIKVINPDDIHEILIQPGRELVTLITCHPYPGHKMRIIVICERQ